MWKIKTRDTRKVYNQRGAVHGLNLPQKFFEMLCNLASDDNYINYVLLENETNGCRFIAICNADETKDLVNTVNRSE